MSLRGSLDTFALPDVLALLATTAKTGELDVSGRSGAGQVWLDAGQVVAAETAGTNDVVDTLVTLLRLEEGDFVFHGDRPAPDPGVAATVAEVLEQAEARLGEWREVEQVLPSSDAYLTLVATAPGSVRLTRDQWTAVVAIGEGRSVATLVDDLGGDELTRWRLLASLVDAGLVEVDATPASAVAPVRRTEVAEQLSAINVESLREHDDEDDADVVTEDEHEADQPVPTSAAATTTQPTDPADGVSRGTLLKFLSSVRS